VLSHENVPPGILEGTEPLPEDWLEKRLRELDLLEIFQKRS
jgi:hypothetical protein